MKDDERAMPTRRWTPAARPLPAPVRWLMRGAAKVMTTTAAPHLTGRPAAGQASTISWLVVISAVLPSMMLAEQ
jgi:hypothetical protein